MAMTTTSLSLSQNAVAALNRQRPDVRCFKDMNEWRITMAAMLGIGMTDHSANWILAYLIGVVDFVTPSCIVDHVNRHQSMRLDANYKPIIEFSDSQWEAAVSMTKACLQEHDGATDAACDQMTKNCKDARQVHSSDP
jgi:hypothetical protein